MLLVNSTVVHGVRIAYLISYKQLSAAVAAAPHVVYTVTRTTAAGVLTWVDYLLQTVPDSR